MPHGTIIDGCGDQRSLHHIPSHTRVRHTTHISKSSILGTFRLCCMGVSALGATVNEPNTFRPLIREPPARSAPHEFAPPSPSNRSTERQVLPRRDAVGQTPEHHIAAGPLLAQVPATTRPTVPRSKADEFDPAPRTAAPRKALAAWPDQAGSGVAGESRLDRVGDLRDPPVPLAAVREGAERRYRPLRSRHRTLAGGDGPLPHRRVGGAPISVDALGAIGHRLKEAGRLCG